MRQWDRSIKSINALMLSPKGKRRLASQSVHSRKIKGWQENGKRRVIIIRNIRRVCVCVCVCERERERERLI